MPPTNTIKRKADDISKDDGAVEEAKKEDVVQVAEEVAAAAAAAAADTDAPPMAVDDDADADADADAGDDKDDDDGPGSASKRRFFPRIKHLLTPEWGDVSILTLSNIVVG